ncbi:MAG: DUF6883 domain-containing protein [Stellaceae bacterium]
MGDCIPQVQWTMVGCWLPNASASFLFVRRFGDHQLYGVAGFAKYNIAKFFLSFGFSQANWAVLKHVLLAHPLANSVKSQTTTPYGEKYLVSCSLMTPDGRNPCVVTVWIIEPADPNPRFVTAYAGP